VPTEHGDRNPGRRGRVSTGPEVRTGPVGEFAYRLWELKKSAGDPSYDRMRTELGALASKSALSAAARGLRLPSWETTWEYVRAIEVGVLGEDTERARQRWREQWERAVSDSGTSTEPIDVPAKVPVPEQTRAPAKRGLFALIGSVVTTVVVIVTIGVFDSADSANAGPDPVLRAEQAGPVVAGDVSTFVGDVTIPDGTEVKAGTEFVKTWEIHNGGSVQWTNRFLQREGSFDSPDSCASVSRVPVPETAPGQNAQVTVTVRAPMTPGWCQVHFKMVDSAGRILLPGARALFFFVKIVR